MLILNKSRLVKIIPAIRKSHTRQRVEKWQHPARRPLKNLRDRKPEFRYHVESEKPVRFKKKTYETESRIEYMNRRRRLTALWRFNNSQCTCPRHWHSQRAPAPDCPLAENQKLFLVDLPTEILINLFSHLGLADHRRLERVHSKFLKIIRTTNTVSFQAIQHRLPAPHENWSAAEQKFYAHDPEHKFPMRWHPACRPLNMDRVVCFTAYGLSEYPKEPPTDMFIWHFRSKFHHFCPSFLLIKEEHVDTVRYDYITMPPSQLMIVDVRVHLGYGHYFDRDYTMFNEDGLTVDDFHERMKQVKTQLPRIRADRLQRQPLFQHDCVVS